jgi:hypothetical protein
MKAEHRPAFIKIYNLLDDDAYERALRERARWGVLHTSVSFLDDHHAILSFHPAPDPRWRAWEEVRRGWILETAA